MQALQRVATGLTPLLSSAAPAIGASTACALRRLLNTSAEAAEQAVPKPAPAEPKFADIEFELDHDDPDLVDKRKLWEAAKPVDLPHVDLEFELDHDDPEAVDKKELWEEPKPVEVPRVDLDDEMDLTHDKPQ